MSNFTLILPFVGEFSKKEEEGKCVQTLLAVFHIFF